MASWAKDVHPRKLPRLLRLELFKLRRRPMPLVLAGILAIACFGLPLLLYVVFRLSPDERGAAGGAGRQELIDRVVFPGVLTGSVDYALAYGMPLLIVLTAASFGGEFAWGTVRLLLARGEARADYVLSKLGSVVAWWTVALLVGVAAALATSLLLWATAGEQGIEAVDRPAFAAFLAMLARGWFASLSYVTLTALLTMQLRSTAWGLAAALFAFFGEGIVGGAASTLDVGPLEWLIRVGINYNVKTVINNGANSENPPLVAAALLTFYVVIGAVGAVRHLQRHDVVVSGVG